MIKCFTDEIDRKYRRHKEPVKLPKPRTKFTDTKHITMNYHHHHQRHEQRQQYHEEYYEDFRKNDLYRSKSSSPYVDNNVHLSVKTRKALYRFDKEFKKKLNRDLSNNKLNNSF